MHRFEAVDYYPGWNKWFYLYALFMPLALRAER